MDNLELKAFMAPIFKYGIATACLMAAASMLVIGWDPFFVYGLTLGTSVSIVNHILLAYTANFCLSSKRGTIFSIIGYMMRLIIYGFVFYTSYKSGITSAMGTLLGFVTLKIAIYYYYGFKPGFASKKYDKAKLNDLDQDEWAKTKESKNNRGSKICTQLNIWDRVK